MAETAVSDWFTTTEKRSHTLSYRVCLDAAQYKDEQLIRPVPTLILHGCQDEVIPIQASHDFANCTRVQLISLESDHSLGNVLPEIWQAIQVSASYIESLK